MLSIESLLLARYAEVLPDGTITAVGAGISAVIRPPETDTQIMAVATLLAEGPTGRNPHRLYCKMRSPEGELMLEFYLDVTVEGGVRRRVPLVFPVPLPQSMQPGEWSVELSGRDELKTVLLEVGTTGEWTPADE